MVSEPRAGLGFVDVNPAFVPRRLTANNPVAIHLRDHRFLPDVFIQTAPFKLVEVCVVTGRKAQ